MYADLCRKIIDFKGKDGNSLPCICLSATLIAIFSAFADFRPSLLAKCQTEFAKVASSESDISQKSRGWFLL